ncbi:BZIP domain-containing protein, partial [Meloidogyne graminicola]
NRPKSVICTSNSILNNEFLNENKSFLNICSTTKNTETSTFNNILEKAFESSPNHSNIQGCSHSIITKDNLNSFNCSERKTINGIYSSKQSIYNQNNQQNNSSILRPLAHFWLQKQEQNKKQYLSEILNLNDSHSNSSELFKNNSYLIEQSTTKRIEEKNQQEQEQQQQPSSSQQCTSTFSELIINSFSTSQSTPTTTTTSSHSSSSNSMLGTLLAAPNKRQISPTVPASRTELFSGLTEFQRNEIKIIENEQNKQQTSKFSSSNICQIKKVSISSSSDSEHSTNQHSPTSLHSNISRLSPNSSTFPGISNSITIGGGGGGENDRIRRDGSFSPSGNSGFSGDDLLVESLQNNYQANLLNNGQHLIENTLKISENVHQQLTDNENCINSEIEGEIGSIRIKLKTNEELERYMDRRRRNNEAAKRCRANRRAVFEYRSRRAQMLEAENGELRQEMIKLNNELEQLKALIAANAVASAQQSPQQQNQRLMHKT